MRGFAVMLAVALLSLWLPAVAPAAGGTYKVVECDPLNRADEDVVTRETFAYSVNDFCADASGHYSIQIENRAAAELDHRGLVRFPTGSTELGIVGVSLDAKLRGENGSQPRLWLADSHLVQVDQIAGGDSPGTDFHHYSWSTDGPGASQFVASLTCVGRDRCPESATAKVWIRDLRLTVADYGDPLVQRFEGTLSGSVWISGLADLSTSFADVGSGVASLGASANGQALDSVSNSCAVVPGSTFGTRIEPCADGLNLVGSYDTAIQPFRDGSNDVTVCAADFASNATCESRSVNIDNTPPVASFVDSQRVENPELIQVTVSDATSGIASGLISYRPVGGTSWQPLPTTLHNGSLQAYVDSSAVPSGDYEFMASAIDVAGNQAQTTQREDGQPMVLTFPLKAATRLRAHLVPGAERRQTVGYGRNSRVTGRLLNASGAPIRGEYVRVVEHFGSGALINRRVRRIRTSARGFWHERIPAGPSRSITASYGGSTRYLGDGAKAGRLLVRSKARFRASKRRVKEGRSVVFHGRVHHRGARIPSGGKLVELQVRDGKFWNTVRQAFHTRSDGRYRLHYRFRADYVSNARFRFRVKVAREQGWPYLAPVRTHARKLVVVAR